MNINNKYNNIETKQACYLIGVATLLTGTIFCRFVQCCPKNITQPKSRLNIALSALKMPLKLENRKTENVEQLKINLKKLSSEITKIKCTINQLCDWINKDNTRLRNLIHHIKTTLESHLSLPTTSKEMYCEIIANSNKQIIEHTEEYKKSREYYNEGIGKKQQQIEKLYIKKTLIITMIDLCEQRRILNEYIKFAIKTLTFQN